MCRMLLIVLRVSHLLNIAVIGGYQHLAAHGLDRLFQSSQTLIERLYCRNGGLQLCLLYTSDAADD